MMKQTVERAGRKFRILALLLMASLGGCEKAADGPPEQVFFILLDTARPDRFSCYGHDRPTTPNLDRLATEGAIFLDHFSQGSDTRTAMPSLMYSRYYFNPIFPASASVPLTHPQALFRKPDDQSFSMPAAFAVAGWRTVAFSAHPWFRPETRLAREFQEFHALETSLDYDQARGFPPAEQVVDVVLGWLEENPLERSFVYIHLMDPHLPRPPGEDALRFYGVEYSGRGFQGNGSPKRTDQLLSADDKKYLDALYDGSLAYADRQLGRLFDYLEEKGELDSSLIVFTSDHGEYLMEAAGRLGHGGPWRDTLARVPLVVFHPGSVQPMRVSELTEAVDVSPTVLGLAGIPVPRGKRPDGVDLLDRTVPPPAPREHVFRTGGIRDRRYKLLFDANDRRLLKERPPDLDEVAGKLFDLQEDPLETRNLWQVEPDRAAEMLAVYRDKMQRPYRRLVQSTTDDPPEGPFAVSTLSLSPNLEIPKVAHKAPDAVLKQVETPHGWVQAWHYKHNFWLAQEGATPIRFAIELPDGEYLLTARMAGAATLTLQGRTPQELAGTPYREDRRLESDWLEVGRIEVSKQRFRGTLEPRMDGGWFLLQYFGFQPVVGGQVQEEDPERLERLRTLGYVG